MSIFHITDWSYYLKVMYFLVIQAVTCSECVFYQETVYSTYKTDEPLYTNCQIYSKILAETELQPRCAAKCSEEPACMYFTCSDKCYICMLKSLSNGDFIKDNAAVFGDNAVIYGKWCNGKIDGSYVTCVGSKFTGNAGSYILYKVPSIPDIRVKYNVRISFKTSTPTGIIIFAADATTQRADFAGVYMLGGKIYHKFNNGDDTATLVTANQYSDGQWHELVLTKDRMNIGMAIEGENLSGSSSTSAHAVDSDGKFYLGGITSSISSLANSRMGITDGFNGCLKNITMNGGYPGKPTGIYNVNYCE